MEPLPIDAAQLQRRDPVAWTELLTHRTELNGVIVTAVNSEPIANRWLLPLGRPVEGRSRNVRRYFLTLSNTSDPVSFIGKRTNAEEARVYRALAHRLPGILPRSHYVHDDGDHSWLILDDVPDDHPPASWSPAQADRAVETLARLQATVWHEAEQTGSVAGLPHFNHLSLWSSDWEVALRDSLSLLVEGPGAVISEHALRNAGRLSPAFLEAANGLVVMRDLGGWPGVLGESHLAAAADLLDDPVPVLAALNDLPQTLLHSAPQPQHWRSTLFDEAYLLDWKAARVGPGILDLVAFIESYPMMLELSDGSGSAGQMAAPISADRCESGQPHFREMTGLLEQTLVDGYMLSMSSELGGAFPARAMRQAIPAARCLYVLLTWFPFFARWYDQMPDRYLWHRLNRDLRPAAGASRLGISPGFREHLAGVFQRFLHAYSNL